MNFFSFQKQVLIYSFFIVGVIINKIVAGFLVKPIFTQERCEGNFRFRHVSLRASSEPVAFLNGSSAELQKLDESFTVLIASQTIVVNRTAFVKCKDFFFLKKNYSFKTLYSLPFFSSSPF